MTTGTQLYEEVIDSGLCTGCAGCVVACPHDVIGYDHEAVPAVVGGAVAAPHVPGQGLLVLSGVLLLVLGLRLAGPVPDRSGEGRSPRRAVLIVPVAALVGLLTGLLANSGGFLLVPMFILVAGLDARRAAGTSLLAAACCRCRPSSCTAWWATSTGGWPAPSPWD